MWQLILSITQQRCITERLRLYISSRAHVITLARSLDFKPRFAVLAYTDLTLRFTERCASAGLHVALCN